MPFDVCINRPQHFHGEVAIVDEANCTMRDSANYARIVREYTPKGNPVTPLLYDRPDDRRNCSFGCSCTGNNKLIEPVFVIFYLNGEMSMNITKSNTGAPVAALF